MVEWQNAELGGAACRAAEAAGSCEPAAVARAEAQPAGERAARQGITAHAITQNTTAAPAALQS